MCLQTPRANIIHRSFAISKDINLCGSCFAIPINGAEYLITAAHVLSPMEHRIESELYIFRNSQWNRVSVTPYYMSGRTWSKDNNDIDIVVIKTSIKLESTTGDVELSSNGLILGQDVYFLEFPFLGGQIKYGPADINDGYPLPFIKKATLSGSAYPRFYLDGHNNPGFSGGPVIFWNYTANKHQVLGVISSYISQGGEVKLNVASTNLFYQENSGIAIAYQIECVNKFIIEEGYK